MRRKEEKKKEKDEERRRKRSTKKEIEIEANKWGRRRSVDRICWQDFSKTMIFSNSSNDRPDAIHIARATKFAWKGKKNAHKERRTGSTASWPRTSARTR